MLQGNRWKFVLSGGLLGVFFNVLPSVVFMEASDFFVVAGLTGFFVVAVCVFGAVWGLKEFSPFEKVRFFLFGVLFASVLFTFAYLFEFLVFECAPVLLNSKPYFAISRVPFISFFVSLSTVVLLSLVQTLLSKKLSSNAD